MARQPVTFVFPRDVVTIAPEDAEAIFNDLASSRDASARWASDYFRESMSLGRTTVDFGPIESDEIVAAIDRVTQTGAARAPRDLDRLRRALMAEFGDPVRRPKPA